MGSISYDTDYGKSTLIDRFSYDDFFGELYLQKNGSGTNQRVMNLNIWMKTKVVDYNCCFCQGTLRNVIRIKIK